MGFRGSRVQIPPSRLVQRISPATGSVVGLFFPLRPPVRASGGSAPLGPAAPIGRHAPPCVCAGSRRGAGSSPPNLGTRDPSGRARARRVYHPDYLSPREVHDGYSRRSSLVSRPPGGRTPSSALAAQRPGPPLSEHGPDGGAPRGGRAARASRSAHLDGAAAACNGRVTWPNALLHSWDAERH